MAGSVDTLTVSDISWSQAMEHAVRVLRRGDEESDKRSQQYAYVSANASLAQAWIALAREITMHARAAE
jgi:hypothetical protein